MVNVGTMDLNLLRVLRELLREQNVTRAAAQLGQSQAATSHALARLRKTFGDQLLVRSGQRLQLTPEAERLAPIVEDILRLVNTSLSAPDFDPGTASATFTVAMPDFLNALLIPDLIALIGAQAPNVTVHVRATPIRTDTKLEGVLDAIAMPAQRVPAGSPSWRLGTVGWTGIAGQGRRGLDEPLTLPEFAAMPQVTVPRALVYDVLEERLKEAGLRRNIAVTLHNTDLLPRIIADTDLVAVGWQGLVASGIRTFALPVELPAFDYHIAWSRRLSNDPASMWLRRQLVAIASRRLPQ